MKQSIDYYTGITQSENFGRNVRRGTIAMAAAVALAYITHQEHPIKLPADTREVVADKPGEKKFLPPAGTANQVDCGAPDSYFLVGPVRSYHRSTQTELQNGHLVEYVICGTPRAQIPENSDIQVIDTK